MEKKSQFRCDCGEILEVAVAMEIFKCRSCGKPWLKKQWEQKLKVASTEGLIIPEEVQTPALEVPALSPHSCRKPLPATQMFSQDEILEIKEASLREEEEKAEKAKKVTPRPLPATKMFSLDEIEDVKKTSIESKPKPKEKK